MKITTDQIKAIPAGAKMTFTLDNQRSFHSSISLVSYVQCNYPELGVRYKCSSNRKALELTIEAIKL